MAVLPTAQQMYKVSGFDRKNIEVQGSVWST